MAKIKDLIDSHCGNVSGHCGPLNNARLKPDQSQANQVNTINGCTWYPQVTLMWHQENPDWTESQKWPTSLTDSFISVQQLSLMGFVNKYEIEMYIIPLN